MKELLGFFSTNLKEIYRVPSGKVVKLENINVVNADTVAHQVSIYMSNLSISPVKVPIFKVNTPVEAGGFLRDTDGYVITSDCTILVKCAAAPVENTLSYAIFGSYLS